MFGYHGVGIVSEYFMLEILIRCRVFTEVNIQLTQSRLGEISLLKLFGDFLCKIEHLKLEELLELVILFDHLFICYYLVIIN